jgi:Ca2+-binding RTX toxin-like protein
MTRTHRRTLTAAAAALCTAVALPAAAEAGTISINGTTATFAAAGNEVNRLQVSVRNANTVEFIDTQSRITLGGGCREIFGGRTLCESPRPFTAVSVNLGDSSDHFRMIDGTNKLPAPLPIRVVAGDGQDTYFGGDSFHPTRVTWLGGDSFDTVDWSEAEQGVLMVKDSLATPDGRQGKDRDEIGNDTEQIIGSPFNDILVGSDNPNVRDAIDGGLGDDTIDGRLGADTFLSGQRDGADRYVGGRDGATIHYAPFPSQRAEPISAVVNDGLANDGAIGERDNLNEINEIFATTHGDSVIVAQPVPGKTTLVSGSSGNDTLIGSNAADTLVGSFGADTLTGNGGDDTLLHFSPSDLRADDSVVDTIEGGTGSDRATSRNDKVTGVEFDLGVAGFGAVGKVSARATRGGFVVSWRHPVGWRKLRSIDLILRDRQGIQVGTIAVKPRTGAVKRQGVRAAVRVTHKGKTAVARVRLGRHESLGGRTVYVDVEATDTSGRRQLAPAVAKARLR